MSSAPELKATLTLPETKFPMKANLPQNEPVRLQQWEESGLYEQIRQARKGAEKYILHYGPPYANGPIHLGHALQKCIKDFILKSKTMAGYDAPLVPGWDCHGLPIEIKVDEKLGRKKLEMPALSVLRACREYAQKFIDMQREQLIRLGVFAHWDKPYLTMSKPYEAKTLESFYDFFEKGFVYKGLKPVYWCLHDKTALAEAEVEYEQHTSPSVYVRYKLSTPPRNIHQDLEGKQVWTIIWTTTPWTLPASLAVAFHPEFDYVALENSDGNVYIVAESLATNVREACNLEGAKPIARVKGARLEHSTFQHPFLDRSILGVNADYVTADTGTGAVHTAPAHGADDFYTGTRYGLDQTCNVDNEGRLRNGLPQWEGKTVWEANPLIIEMLKERGALMGRQDIYHSYPHCWRCHNPVIFRATEQWFIGMETPLKNADGSETTFRQRALDEIKHVTWDPAWGQERISNMIATRPDWCISRQRLWGVPIAVFLCNKCHTPLNDAALNRRVVGLFHEEGAEAWHKYSVDEILPAGTTCAKCGNVQPRPAEDAASSGANEGVVSSNTAAAFRKETDILDVWFDSGTSWNAVLVGNPELEFPASLYIEGADQHRGWFHSSLLCSVAIKEQAPYKKVATVGWTLDEQGRAFSKSLGNGVDPVDIAKRLGAEIVRLWAASVDFREDVTASENLMQRAAENYRKLRNTFKFLLGNLQGFVPARDAVKDEELLPLDRYMLARTRELTEKVLTWYDEFEFHRVYHAINEFTIVDLSALYLDVLKDRMYTFAPVSVERRSAQTVLWKITETLVRLVAPMLTFTAEEVWGYLPHVEGREASVHLALFPKLDDIAVKDEALLTDWNNLLEIRDEVLRILEIERKAGRIGKALEAKIVLNGSDGVLALLNKYSSSLKELFNISQFELPRENQSSRDLSSFGFAFHPADGIKCERCWNYRTDTARFGPWSTVCGRCADALRQMPEFAPFENAGSVNA
ncbi:isoleucyl-tRNA synthetase [Silvibacterium bohemicum]|uniref:Isoleucine--tRNA ligase n=1 Tax=Silvibacterium bohemicum TaxID=1577686 RepID=A0A841K9Q2_9BACT|nr:isoleucine--tRNA ligase [Silvibacterium bohemicum]MBB6147288.1 isoleucyl-tRNA synthetase [Silvibacterium bohemicum]